MTEAEIGKLQVINSQKPALMEECDRVEKTQFYRNHRGILSGIHEFIRQKYGEDSQAISSKTDGSTGASS